MKIVPCVVIKAFLFGACLLTLIQADQDEPVSVKFKNGYDKAITVTYNNPNTPTTTDYIGLYRKGADCDLTLWLYTSCNSQDSCASVSPSSGSITFDVTDPVAESCKQWPPPKGQYRACLGWETGSGDELIACSDMKIKRPPRKALNKLTLSMSKTSYAVGEAIVATFTTKKMIRNSWVGVYSGSPPTSAKKIPEPMLWVYVGCNNQQGDQSESNDCSVVRKSGQLQIDETSTDRSTESWPLPANTYHLCISLDNNRPYKSFKCFDTFTIA